MQVKHFLSLLDIEPQRLEQLVQRAIELKAMLRAGEEYLPLRHKTLGMVFEKSSTRTRVSFETAMIQFGGGAIFLSAGDTQMGRGEPPEDTARVLSSMVDCIMLRTHSHDMVERYAAVSRVPVINALTDRLHPCQLLADVMTYHEYRGSIRGRKVAWVGDGNNMCHSYVNAARQFDFTLHVAAPAAYQPDAGIVGAAGDRVRVFSEPREAVEGVDLVVTDVWASMGQEEEAGDRQAAFMRYQVDGQLLGLAAKDALFMHCLPAHRGEEVSAEVIDGPQSVVWDEAENRLHSQKALLEYLLVD